MNESSSSAQRSLSTVQSQTIDRLCDRFEAAWKTGRQPRIERYLTHAAPELRAELLRELLALEVEYRGRNGEAPSAQEYSARFPEHADLVGSIFDESTLTAPPQAPGLLPKWVVSRLVREARQFLLPGTESDAYPPDLFGPAPGSSKSGTDAEAGSIDGESTRLVEGSSPESDQGPSGEAKARSDQLARQGRMLGHYRLLERIGQGGMGEVYRAEQRSADRIVALKVIRADRLNQLSFGEHQEWLERFRREGQMAARLQHDHIVTVYEVGEIAGQHFYSMRYVDGHTLSEILRQEIVPSRQAAQYLEPVARAVHAIHLQGMVHRDLKPRNILVDKEGRPYVTDFGLAKWSTSDSEVTHTGAWVGTPSYMSPEQAENPTEVGAKSDIYSLGATLYELLTGRPPFKAADPVETLRQVIDKDPVPPRELNSAIDRDLELICLKCLRKEPDKRYRSASELADELRRYLEGRPLRHTRPVRNAERLWRWCRRNQATSTALAAAAVLLLALAGLSLAFGVHSKNTAATVLAEQKQTEEALDQNQRLKATLELDRGLSLCEHGDVGRGLLWLAQSLQDTPPEAKDLEHLIRMNLGAWRRHASGLRVPPIRHDATVKAVAFSPDGQLFVTATEAGTITIFDANTGQELRRLKKQPTAISSVVFSPDGKQLLTGGSDGVACMWEVDTGKELSRFKAHERGVVAVAFSANGALVLTAGDRVACVWDAATRAKRAHLQGHADVINALAVSSDGSTVVTGSRDGTARIWDVHTGKETHCLNGHQDVVESVAFSPDGRTVVTGSDDCSARLWDPMTGISRGTVLWHSGKVWAVAFSPDGRTILTGSQERTALLWDASSGKKLLSLAHQHGVHAVAFSPAGDTILTGSEDQHARVWENGLRHHVAPILQHRCRVVYGVCFSPDGNSILTTSWDPRSENMGDVRLWDARTGSPLAPPCLHSERIYRIAFSPDNATVLTVGTRARLWDAVKGQLLFESPNDAGTVPAAALSPDGNTLLTGGEDGVARLWNVVSGQPLGLRLRHDRAIWSVAFSPDGSKILTGSGDRTARIWEVSTGQELVRLQGHMRNINTVAYSPDGKTALTASLDGTARLWDTSTGALRALPFAHLGQVKCVAYSPDGESFLTASADGSVQLRRTAPVQPIGAPLLHQGTVFSAAFGPNGTIVLTGSADRTARLWDVATGKPIGPALAHEGNVWSVAFSPDGKRFVTASGSTGKAYIWETPSRQLGSPQAVLLQSQLLTGLRLETDGGCHMLQAEEWERCQRALNEPEKSLGP
jgi:WD40 repeat protein/tRNA A-37 threonylcarbamoyl transferase component Bud32